MISREDVKKLAALARIKLAPEEEEKFAKDLENILGYVTQIQKVSGTVSARGSEKVKNVLREDSNPHESGAFSKEILEEAPKLARRSLGEDGREGDYIKVKKIL